MAGAAESVLAGAASAELLIGSSGDSQQSARLIPHSLASEDFLEPDTDTLEPAEEPLTLFPLFLEDEP